MFWILWANKRLLTYIKPFNPKKDMRLADSKLKTKNLLKDLDIPHPLLLDVIKDRKQLKNYSFEKFIWKDFVIKPNRWSKWKWIMICYMIGKQNIKASWNIYNIYEFKKQVADILDWKYSLTLWNDRVFIEEKIIPWDDFDIFCEFWLADIRIIVRNLVPVMAMLRYPNKESWWTANIAKWWIWFGIDIGSWKIISMYYKRKIYNKIFPDEYKNFQNKVIPYWDDMLLYSSQIQYFTNIWYLWLDWAISKKWPNLIEINARAGMEIQLVNSEWIDNRLRKINDMKIISPSKWVEIWKTIFSKKHTNPTIQKNMLYLEQPWILKYDDIKKNIIVKVDFDHTSNFASKNIILDFSKSYTIKIQNIIIDNIKFKENNKLKNTVTIWTIELENFIIVPKKKDIKDFYIWNKEKIIDWEQQILEELDNDLDKVSKKLNISRVVKPINYMEELDNFITWYWNYNPKFQYKYPSDKKLEDIENILLNLKEKYFDIKTEYKSWLIKLFDEKYKELEYKLKLIKAYKKQDFKLIWKYNKLLYGNIEKELLIESKTKMNPFAEKNLWRLLSINEIYKKVRKYLNNKWLFNIKIVIQTALPSRILVKRWDPIIVNISQSAEIYEKEINMILAHEIDVHVVRYINWKTSWWKILQSWTWFYLKDEEWLAIWNSFIYLPKNYEKNAMYEKYFLISQAEKADFVNLTNIIKWLYPTEWLLKIFRRTIRFKRWIQNTAFKWEWTAYYKDKIYLDGYMKVKSYIENWGSFENMLHWKYKIKDLEYINQELLNINKKSSEDIR